MSRVTVEIDEELLRRVRDRGGADRAARFRDRGGRDPPLRRTRDPRSPLGTQRPRRRRGHGHRHPGDRALRAERSGGRGIEVPLVVLDVNVLVSAGLSRRGAPAHFLAPPGTNRCSSSYHEAAQRAPGGPAARALPTLPQRARGDRIRRRDQPARRAVADPAQPPAVLRNPDDDYLVALARAGQVSVIVTGDLDLTDHTDLKFTGDHAPRRG